MVMHNKKRKHKKKTKSFWDLRPFEYKGKDSGKLSAKIDEVIYG